MVGVNNQMPKNKQDGRQDNIRKYITPSKTMAERRKRISENQEIKEQESIVARAHSRSEITQETLLSTEKYETNSNLTTL